MTRTHAQEAEVTGAMQACATACRKKDIRTLSALFSPEISGSGSGPAATVA